MQGTENVRVQASHVEGGGVNVLARVESSVCAHMGMALMRLYALFALSELAGGHVVL